ncbi:hypothetical protein [Limnohabitans sp.]|uniref:hypothetical protein n=1 Tax=Limnohabitans sp. TaxID=1907725 RepID=UPI0025C40952|nr:hypothetical protein [Limnohabitans sp.]
MTTNMTTPTPYNEQDGPAPALSHLIDCHVLNLPRFNPGWVNEMRADLDTQPVNQHWLPGIDGQLGEARACGFALGCAPFVTSVDPDDRINPGTFAALLKALQDNPGAPFAWAGEQMVNERLEAWPVRPNVWPGGYDPLLHTFKGTHVHGVKLYRRELVLPYLPAMRTVGQACEFYLDLAIVKPYTNPSPTSWPVHVPMVGRLWRQHDTNGSRYFEQESFTRAALALGFESMNTLQAETRRRCL